ncbi:hypothetical protein VFPPC_14968 [Pochonia chlamydosporia 170]|uniref:Uncharacterized protein n=1 Tax=Pochonia chlamydosporia 170 TaxID=1380566 RepID=A0A179EXM6_METCM|nr:hypothetical protein VFPPC_14968 [Pochonia chlamydosporia 170]OAQ57947.1 hypothetical protein VFPPC_14968 [Pochonia chlamydosporia 170]
MASEVLNTGGPKDHEGLMEVLVYKQPQVATSCQLLDIGPSFGSLALCRLPRREWLERQSTNIGQDADDLQNAIPAPSPAATRQKGGPQQNLQ